MTSLQSESCCYPPSQPKVYVASARTALFQPIIKRLDPGFSLDDTVDVAIDFCDTELLWDELLAGSAVGKERRNADA